MNDNLENRRQDDPRVALLSVGLKALHEDILEIKSTLKELASAIIKLALLEERQERSLHTQKHILNLLDKLSDRVVLLEIAKPNTERTGRWLEWGLFGLVAAVAMFIGKKVGLM